MSSHARFSSETEIAEDLQDLKSLNDGMNPITEPVTLDVGTFSATFPPGSFTLDEDGFSFEGAINGVCLELEIRPLTSTTFALEVDGEDADLTGTVNPVTVKLTIGNDIGEVTVTAEFD